uniref:ACB domain-containing protein n=1 Tax=Amphimedon queenslandica TaxID=400682 RepID=A0A1X7UFU2_AMPQE
MAATGKGPKERPLIERFETAVTVIRSLPKDGPFQPSDMVKLKFYGLYKVVKEGPNNTSKPAIWDPTGRAKWEAWKMCSSLDKEKAMTMYIQELEQIIETMPQTKQVEDFMKAIGPFYEFADDEGEVKEEESGGGDEGETMPSSAKKVTFNDQPSSNEDSDGDLEFEDSYDKLPSNITPPKPSQSLSERRPTPYVHSQATSLTDQKPDALSTNLFQSPNTSDLVNPQPTSSSADSQTLHSLLSQLIHNTQVLTQQFRCLLDQACPYRVIIMIFDFIFRM